MAQAGQPWPQAAGSAQTPAVQDYLAACNTLANRLWQLFAIVLSESRPEKFKFYSYWSYL